MNTLGEIVLLPLLFVFSTTLVRWLPAVFRSFEAVFSRELSEELA